MRRGVHRVVAGSREQRDPPGEQPSDAFDLQAPVGGIVVREFAGRRLVVAEESTVKAARDFAARVEQLLFELAG